jgi:spore maturation protein CgeB
MPQIYDVAFVGNWSPWREEVIKRALSLTHNIALYGPNWQKKCKLPKNVLARIYKGQEIFGDERNHLLNSTKIVLGIKRFLESSGLNMRFFEVLAARACYLTDPTPELNTFFTPGEHLYTYENADQLAMQIQILLHDNALRDHIRDSGYQHVRQNHTYDNMAQTLLATYKNIKLGNCGKPCLKPYSMP